MDYQLGYQVAIKRINQINSVLVAKRTLRELKLLRHFQGHPNVPKSTYALYFKELQIISVIDLFKMDKDNFDELYIAQELMDADLCHIIQSKYPLSEEAIKRFLYQLLRGIKAMHSANVLHRDLKPGNILWKHSGELKICDFGLARGLAEPLEGSDISMTNYVATRWYRPPEILLYKALYGKSLDIWSVGCILAEMYGRRVFLPGSSAMDQFNIIIQRLGTPSSETIARIPSTKSRQYLERMVKYPPINFRERFPNISDLGLDLLAMMLEFDPEVRITAEDALAHPYLASYHNAANEPSLPPFDFSFDSRCVTLHEIKAEIMSEISRYHQPSPLSSSMLKPMIPQQAWKDPSLTSSFRNLSIPNNAQQNRQYGTKHEDEVKESSMTTKSIFSVLPPMIKRRFSLPNRNPKPGPNSSA